MHRVLLFRTVEPKEQGMEAEPNEAFRTAEPRERTEDGSRAEWNEKGVSEAAVRSAGCPRVVYQARVRMSTFEDGPHLIFFHTYAPSIHIALTLSGNWRGSVVMRPARYASPPLGRAFTPRRRSPLSERVIAAARSHDAIVILLFEFLFA